MKNPKYKVILYYKYVRIDDPIDLISWWKTFCIDRNIKGRIIVGDEGVNGTAGGRTEDIDEFMEIMRDDPRFADIDFKESFTDTDPFPKLKIKYRKEIVSFGQENIDMNVDKQGQYLSPEQLQEMIDNGVQFHFVDARNEYEWKIGKFKDAIVPEIENFREFPDFLKKLEHLKDDTLVFYCTGGIRCEKATAYALKQGFRNVFHIKGGIQRYAEKYPKGAFEGSMYIFDDRIAVAFDEDEDRKILTKCMFCGKPSDSYKNCFNAKCNLRMIACDDCYTANEGCCSEECKQIKHKRRVKFRFENLIES